MVISNVYFVFIIYQVFASNTGTKKRLIAENEKVIQNFILLLVDSAFLLPAHWFKLKLEQKEQENNKLIFGVGVSESTSLSV